MTRLVLAMVAAMVLSGCQHSGQQVVDPFWGRQTVPPPATGSICTPAINPGCQQPVQQPLITQGTPVPSGGLQTTTPPNLLPAPTTPALAPHMPNTPANVTPIPATPAPAGSGVPYGNAGPAMTAPPFERLFDAKPRPFVGLFQPGCVVIGHNRDTAGNAAQHGTGRSLSHMALVIDHTRRHIPLDQRVSSCGHCTQLFRANYAHAGRSATYQFAARRLGAGLCSPRRLQFSR